MKRWLAAAFLLAPLCATADPAGGEAALGVILGEPTGLSGKLWLDRTDAIDAAAAWSFGNHEAFQLHADYLIHRYDVFEGIDPAYGKLPLYFGIGGRFKSHGGRDDRAIAGVRVPVGVTYLFARVPFDVFGEVVPTLDVAPETEVRLNVAIGGRFYFGRSGQLRQ